MTSNVNHTWRTAEDVFKFLGIQEIDSGQEYIGRHKPINKHYNLKVVIKYAASGDEIAISVRSPNRELCQSTNIKYATFNKNDNDQWACTTATNYGYIVSSEYNKGDPETSLATRVSRLSDRDSSLLGDQLRAAFTIEARCAGHDYNVPQDVLKSIQDGICKTQEDGGCHKYKESSIFDRLNPINKRYIPS